MENVSNQNLNINLAQSNVYRFPLSIVQVQSSPKWQFGFIIDQIDIDILYYILHPRTNRIRKKYYFFSLSTMRCIQLADSLAEFDQPINWLIWTLERKVAIIQYEYRLLGSSLYT